MIRRTSRSFLLVAALALAVTAAGSAPAAAGAALAREVAGAVGASHVPFDVTNMGGEDFAFYCHEVPSCFFALGLVPPGEETMPQLHQPTFDFNDDAIPVGVELFCRLALRE